MICLKCSKLNIFESKKKCVKCKGEVYYNLHVLCTLCALDDGVCPICLKKTSRSEALKVAKQKCNCG